MTEILSLLFQNIFFSNINNSSSRKILTLLIENYHHLNFNLNQNQSFTMIENNSKNFNRQYLLALDMLMKFIETSTIKCPYNVQLSNSKYSSYSIQQLLSIILNSSCTNIRDCIEAFRIILKQIFNNSMIEIIEDRNKYVDFKINEKNFDIVIIFLKHLSKMNKRCSNQCEQDFILEYFSTILFGNLYRSKISTKIKQIFQLLVQNFEQIQWK